MSTSVGCAVESESSFNAQRIGLLVGEERALGFLDNADDQRQEQPRSLHYQFVAAHRTVMKPKPILIK